MDLTNKPYTVLAMAGVYDGLTYKEAINVELKVRSELSDCHSIDLIQKWRTLIYYGDAATFSEVVKFVVFEGRRKQKFQLPIRQDI